MNGRLSSTEYCYKRINQMHTMCLFSKKEVGKRNLYQMNLKHLQYLKKSGL